MLGLLHDISFLFITVPATTVFYTIAYTLSLTRRSSDLPHLVKPAAENFLQLKNKVIHWLSNQFNTVSLDHLAHSIIMVRRIGWIGKKPRHLVGDCIVVNFNDSILAQHLLFTRNPARDVHAGITLQPLSFFYPRAPPPFLL